MSKMSEKQNNYFARYTQCSCQKFLFHSILLPEVSGTIEYKGGTEGELVIFQPSVTED